MKNFDNNILTISSRLKNNNFLQNYYYNFNNTICDFKYDYYYHQSKFIKSKIPLIYNNKINNNNINNNKIDNKYIIIKNLLNITQFIKLYKSLKKNKYKNINLLLYNLYVYFKYIKLSKFNYKILSKKINLINLFFQIYNQKIYAKKFETYINILRYKFQVTYRLKIFSNI
jgi:hypothetical protein